MCSYSVVELVKGKRERERERERGERERERERDVREVGGAYI